MEARRQAEEAEKARQHASKKVTAGLAAQQRAADKAAEQEAERQVGHAGP